MINKATFWIILTTPMTPTHLSPQSLTLSAHSGPSPLSSPVSHCALWITLPLKCSRPSMSGHDHRLNPPKPPNSTSAVSSSSSKSVFQSQYVSLRLASLLGRRIVRCHLPAASSYSARVTRWCSLMYGRSLYWSTTLSRYSLISLPGA